MDRTKLSAIAKEYGTMGIGLTMMGVGNGFDEELLESLADHGRGNFYYIEKADDISDIFAKELEGLCAVVAQNVYLTLTPQEGVTLTGTFGYKPTESDGKISMHIGDLFHH